MSGFPGFVKHSCPYTWGELFCVKEEVSASLWGILLTGQQVQDSLTCCLHQLCECVCVCTWCVWESVCMFMSMAKLNGRQPELWENWLTRQNYWWLWWTKNLPTAASVIFSPEKAVCFQLDIEGKGSAFLGAFFLFVFFSSEKRPSRLTAPFILYYPAWLLTPGELCSQIDALLLWGCSWNIKLY